MKANSVSMPCNFCNALVRKSPSQVKGHVFCGRQCYGRWQHQTQSIKFECEHCGMETVQSQSYYNVSTSASEKHHFCSKKCSSDYNFKRIPGECNHCGVDILIKNARSVFPRHYCSKRCASQGRIINVIVKDSVLEFDNSIEKQRSLRTLRAFVKGTSLGINDLPIEIINLEFSRLEAKRALRIIGVCNG